MKPIIAVGLLTSASFFLPKAAADTGTDSLFDLSLEELSRMTINSVALRQQTPRDSAALVHVIHRDMLESYAVGSLAQALQLLPGFRVLQRTTFNQAFSGLRGFSVNDNDKHLLILLDGVPIRVNSIGGSNRLLYEAFPVAAIERIELIQGQAATLYGSHAVSAVINIVTRSVNQIQSEWRDGALSGHVGQSFKLGRGNLELLLQRQRAFSHWDQQGVSIPAPLHGELASRGDALFARWQDAQHYAQLLLLDGKSTNISTLFAANPASTANDMTLLSRFGAETNISEQRDLIWKWDLAFDRTHIDFATITGHSREIALHTSLRGALDQQLNWLVGMSVMAAEGELAPLLTDWSSQEHSMFALVNYDIQPELSLSAGANYQQLKDADQDLTPQASLVWKANEQWRVKLMYGESFRNADPRERFSNNRTQRGNPDLVAERGLQSTIALSYQSHQMQWQMAWFEQKIKQTISLVRLPDASRVFMNSGDARAAGVQLEMHWQLAPHVLIDGQHVQLFSQHGLAEPDQITRLGLRYQAAASWSASLLMDYASAGRYTVVPNGAFYNPEPAATVAVHAALKLQLPAFCAVCPAGSTLQLFGRNLGQQQQWQVATVSVNTLPMLPERHWGLALSMPVTF